MKGQIKSTQERGTGCFRRSREKAFKLISRVLYGWRMEGDSLGDQMVRNTEKRLKKSF